MRRIKVTGYLEIEDYEYDDGPMGPLTEEAFLKYDANERGDCPPLSGLEDAEYEEVPE